MQKIFLLVVACTTCFAGFSQTYNTDSSLNALKLQKDSTLHALKVQRDSVYQASMHADSIKIKKEFDEKEKWETLKGIALHPAFKAGEMSGVIPIKDVTEIPDPTLEYKLLFELVRNNPDSVAKETNYGLVEIARIINLHVASGIPIKKIQPVIVIHAAALKALTTNKYYQEKYKLDNPNLKLISELKDIGAKFIACGQAMTFFEVKKADMLPDVKVSITAQTVLSAYQLKGYVLFWP